MALFEQFWGMVTHQSRLQYYFWHDSVVRHFNFSLTWFIMTSTFKGVRMFLIFSSQSEMGTLRLAWESSGWMRMFTIVEMSLLLLVAVGDDFFVGSEMNGPFDPEVGSFQHLLPKVKFFTRRVHPQATPALVLAWKKMQIRNSVSPQVAKLNLAL